MALRWMVLAFAPFLFLVLGGGLLERIRPAKPHLSPKDLRFDFVYGGCHTGIVATLAPLAAIVAAGLVEAAGGGLIELRPAGIISAIPLFALYVLARDIAEYAFHRAQHALPLLWSMHSLHHSETAYNAMTSTRHFWAEALLKMVSVYPAIALLFAAPPSFLFVASLIYYVNHFCAHLNLKVSLRKLTLWINNPQYHRLHHSREREHIDVNFADLFPIWDWMFGTFIRPGREEFPETGLFDGVGPRSMVEALAWPLVKHCAAPDAITSTR